VIDLTYLEIITCKFFLKILIEGLILN